MMLQAQLQDGSCAFILNRAQSSSVQGDVQALMCMFMKWLLWTAMPAEVFVCVHRKEMRRFKSLRLLCWDACLEEHACRQQSRQHMIECCAGLDVRLATSTLRSLLPGWK